MVSAGHGHQISKALMEALAIGTLIGITGCELANTVIARSDPQLVVHAVLDPSSPIQYVLVEESLTGGFAVIGAGRYDPANPIVSGNGVPVSGATVTLTDPDGLVMTGVEDRPGGVLSGVYRINLVTYQTTIQRGKRYSLSVAARGAKVTGTTLVPAAALSTFVPTVPFNRDSQFASVTINNVSATRAFLIRIDAPFGPYQLFSIDKNIAISGQARNIFTDDLVRLFYPGFLQMMTVAAVDTNLYDYYRSGNDPFSGTGLINHLSGGLGVFGAMVMVDQRVFDVTQNPAGDSIEGRYTFRTPAGQTPGLAFDIRLFLEARGFDGNPDRISGSHLRGTILAPTRGAVYGTRSGDSLSIDLLAAQSTGQTNDKFRATIKGDSLIGHFDRFNLTCVFVKFGR